MTTVSLKSVVVSHCATVLSGLRPCLNLSYASDRTTRLSLKYREINEIPYQPGNATHGRKCVLIVVVCMCCLAGQIDNFVIGLTNISPTVAVPTIWNYTICGQYPGSMPVGSIASLPCSTSKASGRFIVLQIPVNPGAFVVCELEVYECCSCY